MTQYLLRAMDTRDMYSWLTSGKYYTTLEGIEKDTSDNDWKFPDYVTVIDDNGKKLSCHLSRFKIIEEIE